MTLFQLVKIALDELYIEAKDRHGKKTDAVIKERFGYLTKSYVKLNAKGRAPVDYKDPATRFAYVYKYVAAHGDYVVQLLQIAAQRLGKKFPSGTVRVTCVGGGPGSDIIAVLKFLNDKADENLKKVVCYLLDREKAWADTWTEIDEKLDSKIALNANFQPLDVTDPTSWESERKFLGADIFTLSYFVSEVYALDDKGVISQFWKTLFGEAKSGALFLYDDNGNDVFNDYFDKQWKKFKMKVLAEDTNVRWTPSTSERASELNEYKAKFGEAPKLQDS